jgi:hypothetical protein
MMQIFGTFADQLPKTHVFLSLEFSLDSASSLKQRWRTSGISADFMADYFSTFLAGDEESETHNTQAEIKDAVSFIANELLENALKYGDETAPYPAKVSLQLQDQKLIFISQNSIRNSAIKSFQALIQEIINSDPFELYIQRLEKNAEAEDLGDSKNPSSNSGLGILIMITEYSATFGWKFEPVADCPEIHLVTTMVQMQI